MFIIMLCLLFGCFVLALTFVIRTDCMPLGSIGHILRTAMAFKGQFGGVDAALMSTRDGLR